MLSRENYVWNGLKDKQQNCLWLFYEEKSKFNINVHVHAAEVTQDFIPRKGFFMLWIRHDLFKN